MSPEQQQQRREDVRRETRAYLVERPGLAFNAGAIARRIRAEVDEVKAALAFLVDAAQVKQAPDSLGATPYYVATAAGMLAHERGE